MDQVFTRTSQTLILKNMAYILYNIEIEDLYVPNLYRKFESQYRTADPKHLLARHCYGALRAYYRSNLGSEYGIHFWEAEMEKRIRGVHVSEIILLMQAFEYNRQLSREHFIDKLDRLYKRQILDLWENEVEYHQGNLENLVREFVNLKYYDEEIWT